MDSVEFAALADLLASAYGDQVSLTAFVAGLDIDQIISLTVSDVAEYVAGQLGREPTGG
jgi:acyl carrier protein